MFLSWAYASSLSPMKVPSVTQSKHGLVNKFLKFVSICCKLFATLKLAVYDQFSFWGIYFSVCILSLFSSVIIDPKPILTILLNCGIFLSGYVTMAQALSNLGNLYCKGRKKVDDFTLDSRWARLFKIIKVARTCAHLKLACFWLTVILWNQRYE